MFDCVYAAYIFKSIIEQNSDSEILYIICIQCENDLVLAGLVRGSQCT